MKKLLGIISLCLLANTHRVESLPFTAPVFARVGVFLALTRKYAAAIALASAVRTYGTLKREQPDLTDPREQVREILTRMGGDCVDFVRGSQELMAFSIETGEAALIKIEEGKQHLPQLPKVMPELKRPSFSSPVHNHEPAGDNSEKDSVLDLPMSQLNYAGNERAQEGLSSLKD